MKDHTLVHAVRKLIERQLREGRPPADIHMDLQRAFVDATVKVNHRVETPDYPLHASGKPYLHWQHRGLRKDGN